MNALLEALSQYLTVWSTTRAAAVTSYLLLFVSILAGLMQGSRWSKGSRKVKLNLVHQWTGWFGLLFGMVHGLVLVFDQYVGYSLVEVLVPFASRHDRLFTGIGTLSFYGVLILVASSDLMKHLGKKVWRAIHFLALPAFAMALVHGIGSGSDSGSPTVQGMYWITGGIVAAMTAIRVSNVWMKRKASKPEIVVIR